MDDERGVRAPARGRDRWEPNVPKERDFEAEQFLPVETRRAEAERRLLQRVLDDALDDLTGAYGAKREKAAAEWIASEEDSGPFNSFVGTCVVLGLDPSAVRTEPERSRSERIDRIEGERRERNLALAELESLTELSSASADYVAKVIQNVEDAVAGASTATVDAAALILGVQSALTSARNLAADLVYRTLPGDPPKDAHLPVRSSRRSDLDLLASIVTHALGFSSGMESLSAERRDAVLVGLAKRLTGKVYRADDSASVFLAEGTVRSVLSDVLGEVSVAARLIAAEMRDLRAPVGPRHDLLRDQYTRELLQVLAEVLGSEKALGDKTAPRFWGVVEFVEALTPAWVNPEESRAEYVVRKVSGAAIIPP